MNSDRLVVLLDVDNTLLDNGLVRERLEGRIAEALGKQQAARFWELYEVVREELDFVSFPETMERFGRECTDARCVNRLSTLLYDFPFAQLVYPESLSSIAHVSSFALPVILSDGDQLFQRYKIRSAGLEDAVAGNVLVYVHKEQEIADITVRFPADHYIMVDDKPRIHAAMKAAFGERLTAVMVCQGKYAHDPRHRDFPEADLIIEGIGGLAALTAEDLIGASKQEGN